MAENDYSNYEEGENALLVNRLNGSRLAVGRSSLADGAPVVSVRYTSMDDYPQRWTTQKIGELGQSTIARIEISNSDETYCLDVDSEDPEVSPSSQARVRKPDGSDRQKWLIREEAWGTNLINIAPYQNRGAGLSLKDHFGHHRYDEAVLVRNFSTTNQLWYWNGSSYHDIIPN